MKAFFLAIAISGLLLLRVPDLGAQMYGPYPYSYGPYWDPGYQQYLQYQNYLNYLQWQQYLENLREVDPYYDLHVMHYQLYLQPYQPYLIYPPFSLWSFPGYGGGYWAWRGVPGRAWDRPPGTPDTSRRTPTQPPRTAPGTGRRR
jgi:hypothetical protein